MDTREKAPQVYTFNETHLEHLRAQIQGSVFVKGEAAYAEASLTWDAQTFKQAPALVVLPQVVADVQAAVIFAREHQLPIAIQGGGHGHPRPADDALLINFARMKRLQINQEKSTAWLEAGVKAGEVVQAAHAYGLAPLNGLAPSVGMVGYLLGGGIGWLTRQYGPGAVSLRAAELVTADGRLLRVDERSHADLLWGLRGGGGNFGIVTALECALYPVDTIFGGQVVYPISEGQAVLSAYAQWIKTVPAELTSVVRIMHFPDRPAIEAALRGKSVVIIMACYNGAERAGKALLQPMRTMVTPLLDTFAQIPYAQVASISNDPPSAPPLFFSGASCALLDLSSNDIDALINLAGKPNAGIRLVEIRQLGGAFAQQDPQAMPFGNHQASLYLGAVAAAPSPELLTHGQQAVAALMQALKPGTTGEVLLNLAGGENNLAQTRAAYTAENYQRLVALKDAYDPTNVLCFNHNIPPSTFE